MMTVITGYDSQTHVQHVTMNEAAGATVQVAHRRNEQPGDRRCGLCQFARSRSDRSGRYGDGSGSGSGITTNGFSFTGTV